MRRSDVGRCPRAPRPRTGGLARWQQRTVEKFVTAHIGVSMQVGTLASLVRLSSSRIWRAFKATFGVTLRWLRLYEQPTAIP